MKILIKGRLGKIDTDNPELLKTLSELYTFRVPGCQFTQPYRLGRWDGKKRFITKDGYFNLGLLKPILSSLKTINCVPDIIPPLQESEEIHEDKLIPTSPLDYYPFQKTLIIKAIKEKKCIVTSPTGSGKTLIMAGILANLNVKRGVVLFNSKQLLTQTYKFFTETCKLKNIGMCFGEGFIYGDILLSTFQSFNSIPEEHRHESSLLMVDECHEFANGEKTVQIINGFDSAEWRFGFTATVPKEPIPLHNLIGAFGPIVSVVNTSNLVEEGLLSKPLIQMVDRPKKEDDGCKYLSYLDVYEKCIVNNEERNALIVKITKNICSINPNSKILVLVNSIEHGEVLTNLMPGSEFIDGKTSISDRYTAINTFRKVSSCQVLIGSKIMQTGVNVDEITHFINARGMKSEIATIQALGRTLRKHKSKSVVYIYDFIDHEKYLNKHSKERLNSYKKEGHEVSII